MDKRTWEPFLSLIAAGILVVLFVACKQQARSLTGEAIIFPPTPTIPIVGASIRASEAAIQPSPSAIVESLAAPQIKIPSTKPAQVAGQPVTGTVPSTATPTEILTPTPTSTPLPCSTPGQVVQEQFQSRTAGIMNYRIYLPPCYSDSGSTYPTLYMLPGNIHSDSIWDELGLDEAAEEGIGEDKLPPFLAVMVAGGSLANNTSGGPGSYESFLVEEFIPHVESNYCAWPDEDGRAIGGLSRGGYWALEIAFRHPDLFTSVGGHSAALADYNGGPTVNPLQTGINNDLGDLRIYLDIGENDWLIGGIRQLHQRLEANAREHTWILNGGYHEEAYWAAHVADYLDWYAEPWLDLAEEYPSCRIGSSDISS